MTSNSTSNPLSLSGYRAWLALHPDEVVGHASDADACPIANYLAWKTGQVVCVGDTSFSVGTYMVTNPNSQVEHPLPQWAQDHVYAYDRLHPDSGDPGRPALIPLLGREVLALLEGVSE